MQISILKKYFLTILAVILISIICLGAVLLLLSCQSFVGKAFVIPAVIVSIIALIAIFVVTLKKSIAINRINVAVKDYSKGDFSKKIAVKGKGEISDLADSLNEMATALSKLEATRKSFFANVSHELRTPMTSMAGFVDGILDGTIPEKEQKKYLTVVSQETKRLSRLVFSMLNMAKIESGEMVINYSTFNIMDLSLECLLTFEKRIDEKEINIEGLDNGKILVYADIDLIHQVVYNLIENAIKFVNKNGYILFSSYIKDDMVYYSIKNSGEGISESELSLVFERFYKSDKSKSVDKTGVGLGLYITSSIINIHHGNIMVNSIEGEYTEFVFSIPTNNNDKGKKN